MLYVHAGASPERALAIVEASLDRLGVCNRLNLCLVDRARRGARARPARAVRGARGESGCAARRALGHEWANDPDPSHGNGLLRGLARGGAADRERGDLGARGGDRHRGRRSPRSAFLDGYRGTAGFWHATTRFTDGFALTGAPETGINVDATPGPRGPVTYRDLWLRQYRVVGDGTQTR